MYYIIIDQFLCLNNHGTRREMKLSFYGEGIRSASIEKVSQENWRTSSQQDFDKQEYLNLICHKQSKKLPIGALSVQNTKMHLLHLPEELSWESKDHSFLLSTFIKFITQNQPNGTKHEKIICQVLAIPRKIHYNFSIFNHFRWKRNIDRSKITYCNPQSYLIFWTEKISHEMTKQIMNSQKRINIMNRPLGLVLKSFKLLNFQ